MVIWKYNPLIDELDMLADVDFTGVITYKGAYAAGTDYAVGDSVDYQGSSYVMFNDAPAGTLPTDTTYWQVLANKGATGATGADGPNNITTSTTTDLTGFLKGNGSVVSADNSTYLTTESDPLALKLDQTTPETIVNGIPLLDAELADFTTNGQIVDKEYVDTRETGGMKSFFFTKNASDIGGMYYAPTTLPTDAVQTITGTAVDGETLLATFITPVMTSDYRVTEGTRFFHFTAKTSSDVKPVQLKGYIYTCALDGSGETLLRTSTLSIPLTTLDAEYTTSVWGDSLVIDHTTTRIIFKIAVVKTGTGLDPTITLSVNDDTFSRLDVPSPVGVTDISGLVPYTGATTDVNLGTHDLSTTGDVTGGNLNIANWDSAYSASHARQHAITSTSDHTSSATSGKMLKADASGLPIDATNTDTEVAAAVTASHSAVTVTDTTTIDFTLSGQDITASVKTDSINDTHIDWGAGANQVNSADLPVPLLGTPTYTTVNDYLKITGSSGRISGMTLSAHAPADGTLDISAGTGFIKITNALTADIKFFDYAGESSIALTDNALNYIYAYYDSGSGTVKVAATTDRSTIHDYDMFTIGRCYREGTDAADITSSGTNTYNEYRRIHNRLVKRYGFSWASGSTLAESDTRKLSVTDGVWYIGNSEIDTSAHDSNAAYTFETYYYNFTTSAWVKTAGVSQLGNTQYNDTTSGTGLKDMTANKWANYWVYLCPAGDLYVVYGQAEYVSASLAQATQTPSLLPNYISSNTRLIARITFQKSATNFGFITNALVTPMSASSVSNHNNLGGLQGGTTSEYYHLTSAEYTATATTGSGNMARLTSPQFTTPTIGAATATSIAIGANTLDTNEWAYLDGQDQGVKVASTPQFTRLGVGVAADGTIPGYIYAASSDILRLAWGTGTGYRGIDFYSTPGGAGEFSAAKILVSHGTSYLNSSFKIQVADGSKTLQDRFTINKDGHFTMEGVTSTGATGTGKLVFDTSPTLVTPTLGVATATRLGVGAAADSNFIIYAPASSISTVAMFERSGSTSNGVLSGLRVLNTKTSDMGDGFGSSVNFSIRDDAGVINQIGSAGFVRAGADNTGDFVVFPLTAGSSNERLRVSSVGHITLEGVTSTGATGTGNFVFDTSPTLITPNIGAATGTTLALGGASTTSGLAYWGGASGGGFELVRFNAANVNGPYVILAHSKSSTVGTAAYLSTNDELGKVLGQSYDTTLKTTAGIYMIAAENHEAGKCGTDIDFRTTPNGSVAAPTSRMKIKNDGHIVIEGVTSTGATGTGKFVFDNTPTLVTPVLGAATGTSLNIGGASGVNLLQINSAATPTISQFRITANNAGSLSLFNYSADNCALGFDVDYNTATTWTARDTSAIILRKLSDVLNFYGDGGLTSGNTYTPTIRSTFSALTGIWTMNTSNTDTGQATLNLNPTNTITTSGNNFNYGISVIHKPSFSSGVTDSGLCYGLSANVLRGYTASGSDRGTLARLAGLNFSIGHFNTDIFSNPTTTNCYGVNVTSYYNRGTITNSYSYFAGANQTIATPSSWTAGATKAANAIVRPTVANGFYYVAQNAGTTHATTEPTWTATENATNTDNDITWFAIKIPSITNEYGVYITSTTAVNYFGGNVSALSFTDRTPHYDGDALKELSKIKGKDGEIDHSTLPKFAQVKVKKQVEKSRKKIKVKDALFEADIKGEKVKQMRPDVVFDGDDAYEVELEAVEEDGRDLGAMISILTKAVQQLTDKVNKLENK